MKPSTFGISILACCFSLQLSARDFIDTQGRKLEGELLKVSNGQVTIKRTADGRSFTVPAKMFSADDQKYFTAFAAEHASYNFEVKYARNRLSKTKTKENDVTTETEQWAYKITLTNRALDDAPELKAGYWIFRRDDDGKSSRTTPRVDTSGSVSLPAIKKGGSHEFQTVAITLNKESLDGNFVYTDNSRNVRKDTTGGLVIRLFSGERQVFEYATNQALLSVAPSTLPEAPKEDK